ncbi:flavin reductase [Cryobacterium frigoriphilum]|uniref:Flavin reductase n=1 Tax=Cryobacterium frigoriphilum TaxID=1259150 RepID=A0A4R9A6U3_9MICO|nr:flavin reductase [Cryobacterium frigoriphilum]
MTLTAYSPDPELLRTTFSHFPTGVVALAAEVDGEQVGMVASSFTVGVSMDPPMVLFSVQNGSTTWPDLRAAGRIGISVLAETHGSACRQLSSRNKQSRFDNLDIETSTAGAIFVHGSPVWLECVVRSEVPAGDHHVVLLEVLSLRTDPLVDPLVYHDSGFRQLHKAA